MSTPSLKHVLREPDGNRRGPAPVLVLLHGLRSNEQDLIQLAPALDGRFLLLSVRAPLTMAHGAYAWYQVEFLENGYIIDAAQAEASRVRIVDFLGDVADSYHVDIGRFYLMGFSQGAGMAASVALSRPDLVAGIVPMSGRLIAETSPSFAPPEQTRGLPALVIHGLRDTVIPVHHGRELHQELARRGAAVSYSEYDMAHEVTMESIREAGTWLSARLDAEPGWRTRSA